MLTLAINPVMTNLLVVFFLIVCVSMILIVLIQRPQGGGLGGAFGAGGGSAGAGQTAFGTKTGDVLTWATVTVFVIFLLVAIALNFATRPSLAGAVPEPVATSPEAQQEAPPAEDPVELPALPGEESTEPPAAADPTGVSEPESVPETDPETDPEIDPASAELPG